LKSLSFFAKVAVTFSKEDCHFDKPSGTMVVKGDFGQVKTNHSPTWPVGFQAFASQKSKRRAQL
jgi:hypothetical protein